MRRSHIAAALLGATLCLLLLVAEPSSRIRAQEPKSLTAILIVARADLPDPYFADSVVLVLNTLGSEPAGIIINHPTDIPVSQLFPEVKGLTQLSGKLYFGGPVEVSSVWFLFRAARAPERDTAVPAFAGVYLSGSRELLLRLLRRERPMEGLKIFVGHAGWGPGQLEGEIARGDWKLERPQAAAIFSGKYDHRKPAGEPRKDGA